MLLNSFIFIYKHNIYALLLSLVEDGGEEDERLLQNGKDRGITHRIRTMFPRMHLCS